MIKAGFSLIRAGLEGYPYAFVSALLFWFFFIQLGDCVCEPGGFQSSVRGFFAAGPFGSVFVSGDLRHGFLAEDRGVVPIYVESFYDMIVVLLDHEPLIALASAAAR